ncbi:MAG: inorganic diphosphatase [Gammaproteobacteria bacterium]|nr:inorganic diphosphatase [Gammaproteobacteria bacterium]
MNTLEQVTPGVNAPHDIHVIIEIPTQSAPVKYEVNKATGALFVDRFLTTAMYYPCNYGYIPQTLSEDGDPVDALVLSPFPLINGSVIRCRPIGMLEMTDEAGLDAKLLAVPINKLSTLYQKMEKPEDVPVQILDTIRHFFEHYKDLEEGKWVKVVGWAGPERAKQEIVASIARYNNAVG